MTRRQRLSYYERVTTYERSLSPEERKRHFIARKYPSGQGRHGGANRSSSLRREVRLKVVSVVFCILCRGSIGVESALWPTCRCQEEAQS